MYLRFQMQAPGTVEQVSNKHLDYGASSCCLRFLSPALTMMSRDVARWGYLFRLVRSTSSLMTPTTALWSAS